ncbi:MAG: Gfo/Idh/MocA family protein [Spirochaetales bacterium]
MDTVRVLVVGLGGYGNGYVDAMLDHAEDLGVELAGAVDPAPTGCRRLKELTAAVGTVYPAIDTFFAKDAADLVIIAAPIHLHAPFTIAALERGAHVLCEKPVAAVVQDARAMAAAEKASAGTVAIGYQWSFSDTIQSIRRDVVAGRFGVPLQMKTLVFWPRPASYYRRSSWAGALKTADGAWVLDSPANNATAHYLHNSFFVLGAEGGRPVSVEAELYRANSIESFDTAAIRVETESGAEVLFSTTHAVPSNVNPVVHYRFSDAELFCNVPGHFYARFAGGSVEDLGSPEATHADKIRRAAADVREGNRPACTIEDASYQSLAVCGAHESVSISDFPRSIVSSIDVGTRSQGGRSDPLTFVNGLQGALIQSFAQGVLPAELGSFEWAKSGRRIELTGYEGYPSGR